MKKDLVCIACPIGCRLTAEWTSSDNVSISGNKCARGEVYGKEEIISPGRVVTATAKLRSEKISRLPVVTTGAFPKEAVDSLLDRIYKLDLEPPVICSDIIMQDIDGTGIDLIAARTVRE